MVDLLPTMLEVAEIEPEHTHFGQSLVPLLSDASLDHRGAAFSEGGFALHELDLLESPGGRYHHKGALQREDPRLVGKAVSIRTPRWTYVHRLYEENELYDRESDPRETTNLAGDTEVAEIERGLREQVLDWMLSTADGIPWKEDPRFDPKLVDIIRSAREAEER
jgi:arylsulfatase A-like enzyme